MDSTGVGRSVCNSSTAIVAASSTTNPSETLLNGAGNNN